jgi:transcriptional antiterminator Rof (Rho-off)
VQLVIGQEATGEIITGVIVDVNTRKDGEYLKLETGREIRLDQVQSLTRKE